MQAEGLAADPALSPGGPFDGRPGDFALSKLNFYQCSRAACQRVYYGGRKECRAQAVEGQQASVLSRMAPRANCQGPCCTCSSFSHVLQPCRVPACESLRQELVWSPYC